MAWMKPFILAASSGMEMPVQCLMTHHLSNQGQRSISARENVSPRTKGPTMFFYMLLSWSFTDFITLNLQSSAFVLSLAVEQKAVISLPTTSWMNLLIFSRRNVSLGISSLPDEKLSPTYHEMRSLSVMIVSPWMRIGTFPFEAGSCPQAFRQVYVKYSYFQVRLTYFKEKSTYFQRRASQALWANGQILFVTSITDELIYILF